MSANCCYLRPPGITLPARPTAKIKNDIRAQLQTSRPELFKQLKYSSVEFGKVLDGRIISIEARHPLVMGKADRGDVLFQPPSERGFPDAEETVDQVSRCHSRFDGAGRTLFWAISHFYATNGECTAVSY